MRFDDRPLYFMALLIVAVLVWQAASTPLRPANAAPRRTVWEYTKLHRDIGNALTESETDWLNRLGADGWELCYKGDGYLFKRLRYPEVK